MVIGVQNGDTPSLSQVLGRGQSSGPTKMIIFQVCEDLEKFGRGFSSSRVLYRAPGSRS